MNTLLGLFGLAIFAGIVYIAVKKRQERRGPSVPGGIEVPKDHREFDGGPSN